MMVFISAHVIKTYKEAKELTEKKRKFTEDYKKRIEKIKKEEF